MTPYAKKVLKKVQRFNNGLEKYRETTGNSNLPDVYSTICEFIAANTYAITTNPEGHTIVTISDDPYGTFELDLEDEGDCGMIEENVDYDLRRLAKAWRIWRSDNPNRVK